ncbi:MAG TPA: YjbH domain-containing protein [Emcibacteraceae bacterium]|nr:YjbH domain-containing protein [Emcibacteraceae bacterium]
MKYIKYALWPTLLLTPIAVKAQDLSFNPERDSGSFGSFGGVGLLEMRNARFSEDGELAVGVDHIYGGQNYYATWQATPWLETTLRFSDYNKPSDGIDKGLDIKVRLLEEGNYKPSIAIGLQDILGDGVFSGEYIVASKKVYNFDISMGFGFGNLAGRDRLHNIMRIFGDGFSRRSFNDPESEKLRFGNYFSGEKMAFFWGLEYKTPIDGLTAKLEYSTVDRSQIDIFKDYKSNTAFNFGLNYKVNSWMEVGGGLLHGNQLALQLTLKQNLHKPVNLGFASGPPVDEIRTRELKLNAVNATDYKDKSDEDIIFERLQQMGFDITSLSLNEGLIEITVAPNQLPTQSKQVVLGGVLETYEKARIHFPDGTAEGEQNNADGQMALKSFRSTAFYSRELANETEADRQRIAHSILDRMADRKLMPENVVVGQNEIWVTKNISPFTDIPVNVGRTARILTGEAPDDVDRFNIISKERGINVSQVSVLRKDFEKIADYNSSPEEILADATIEEPDMGPLGGERYDSGYPNFDFGILPDIETHFGSVKDDHFKGDLNLKIFGRFNLTDDLQVYAEAKQNIIGNLDQLPISDNPNVTHVRSDIGLYAAEGKTSIQRLSLEYIKNPIKNIYTRLTAGHLEAMYSGISGEILYQTFEGSLSFGLDLNYLKQRGYDQLFDMRDYKTFTGHGTLYYVNKKYDITSKVSFGRYLAKDWGTTIDISRQFGNGIKIGAYATFTDMSYSDYGRGSFDKGIYMTIPFDFFWYKQSREQFRFDFRRLGKNGGQKLDHNTNLFDLLSSSRPYKIRNGWGRILE